MKTRFIEHTAGISSGQGACQGPMWGAWGEEREREWGTERRRRSVVAQRGMIQADGHKAFASTAEIMCAGDLSGMLLRMAKMR